MSLFDAVVAGDLTAVRAALEAGEHPDPLDDEGRTPLMRAAELGRVAVMATLLESGADPTLEDTLGETPLHKAAAAGELDAYALLIPYCRKEEHRTMAEALLRASSGGGEVPRPEEVLKDEKWARRFAAAGAKLGSWFGDTDAAKRLARVHRSERK